MDTTGLFSWCMIKTNSSLNIVVHYCKHKHQNIAVSIIWKSWCSLEEFRNMIIFSLKESEVPAWKQTSLAQIGCTQICEGKTKSVPLCLYFSTGRNCRMKALFSSLFVINHIDQTIRNFLWMISSSKQVIHLLHWECLCSSNHGGGLKILNLKRMELSLLDKSIYNLK